MCIIIYIPEGKNLPTQEILENCWENNPHNGGFMYVHNNKIRIRKHTKKDEYIKDVIAFHQKYGAESPFVLHMRYNTQGGITLENTHPFKINSRAAFVHNGVISQCGHGTAKTDVEKKMSDTRLFKHRVLKKMPEHMLRNEFTQCLISYYIGSSKLVFMFSDGCVDIVNEEKGEWSDDIWYSNDYYKSKRKSVVYATGWSGSWGPSYPTYLTTPLNKIVGEDRTTCCRICGNKYEFKNAYSIMVKLRLASGFPHTHYTNVCATCFELFFKRLGLNSNALEELAHGDCDLCKMNINFNNEWRNEIYCVDMTISNLPVVTVACGSCAHGKWKMNDGRECSYSSTDAQWIIDHETREIKLAAATALVSKLVEEDKNFRAAMARNRQILDEDDEIYFSSM